MVIEHSVGRHSSYLIPGMLNGREGLYERDRLFYKEYFPVNLTPRRRWDDPTSISISIGGSSFKVLSEV